jgi:uncharacterized protein (TIGR02145 family)
MKKNLLVMLFLLINSSLMLAQVAINNDNSDPDGSAMLHVKSTTRGFLPPQMSTIQRNAISNPAEGLTIYNLDLKCLEFYTGLENGWYSPCLSFGTISCSNPVVTGQYLVAVPLTASNTVTLSVTNMTTGGYNIATTTENGFRFSKMGTFTTIGSQVIVLTGSGTPLATGTTTFTVTYGNATCTFPVTVINPGENPCPGMPTVSYGGKTYNTVQIGTQCWLKENLNIGTMINNSQEQTNNGIIEKYCYENLSSNCDTYGGLYRWNEIMQYSSTPGAQGICPQGWHLPKSTEWVILRDFLGGDFIASGKMKEAGFVHWLSPNTGATNESGFTGLPAGNCTFPESSYGLGILAGFWSSSEYSATYSDAGILTSENLGVLVQNHPKIIGFSGRCIKDTCGSVQPPAIGTHESSQTNIIWNWNPVPGATGYKWSTVNQYATATDMGTQTTKMEGGLTCSTAYTRFVWAYSACGESTATTLNKSTMACTAPGAPCPGTPTVTYSGKTYNTVQIGEQCWLKENLNVGIRINGSQNQMNNGVFEKYCYDDLESNYDTYGGMYQWSEMMQNVTVEGAQGICPTGWHLPMDVEWSILENYLGGMEVASGKMKESGFIHWLSPNTGATNESGFTALAGGYSSVPYFGFVGEVGSFWTSTEVTPADAKTRYLANNTATLSSPLPTEKTWSMSVRCLKTMCTSAPDAPASGMHTSYPNAIDWFWYTVAGAIGYKWNTVNNYETATDLGIYNNMPESGLIPGTTYTRYTWAYNECGHSPETILTGSTTSFSIGQNYGGGIVFYLDETGQHGLIAAESDQSTGAAWGCNYIPISTSTAIGTGQANTNAILNVCTGGEAARACDNLVLNGYHDWFLPSKDELNQMYLQKTVIGGFLDGNYWSSSEFNTSNAFFQVFTDGSQLNANKSNSNRVRAIRVF